MFNIPPGQNTNDHTFQSFEQFQNNVETHCNLYNVEKKNIFLFMEIEVSKSEQGVMFEKIIEYLNTSGIRFRIFLRAIMFYDNKCPLPSQLKPRLVTDEFLQGNELILDTHYAEELTPKFYSRNKGFMCLKIFQYPTEVKMKNGYSSLLRKYLNTSNIICKSSVNNLKTLAIADLPDAMNSLENRLLQNLKILKLDGCSKGFKKTFFIHHKLPNLKELYLMKCHTSKINDNDLPNLESLVLKEHSWNQYHSRGESESPLNFKMKMVGNKLPKLKYLHISTKKIDQVHLNKFGDKISMFVLETLLENGGTMGDIPHIVSTSESVIILANTHHEGPVLAQSAFENVRSSDKIKNLLINDQNTSSDLDYLRGMRFQNLEVLNISSTDTRIKKLPSMNMPRLKGIALINTLIETVDIRGMERLEKLIFTSRTRDQHADIPDTTWRWIPNPKEFYLIDFPKAPKAQFKAKTLIDLNYYKAEKLGREIPGHLSHFIIQYQTPPSSRFEPRFDEF